MMSLILFHMDLISVCVSLFMLLLTGAELTIFKNSSISLFVMSPIFLGHFVILVKFVFFFIIVRSSPDMFLIRIFVSSEKVLCIVYTDCFMICSEHIIFYGMCICVLKEYICCEYVIYS